MFIYEIFTVFPRRMLATIFDRISEKRTDPIYPTTETRVMTNVGVVTDLGNGFGELKRNRRIQSPSQSYRLYNNINSNINNSNNSQSNVMQVNLLYQVRILLLFKPDMKNIFKQIRVITIKFKLMNKKIKLSFEKIINSFNLFNT